MLTITGLYVYPVKSLGGISLQEATIYARGIRYDRQWMIVDEHNRYLTQREIPKMALLRPALSAPGLIIHPPIGSGEPLQVPLVPTATEPVTVTIFDEQCQASRVSDAADAWLSNILGLRCRLMYMPDTTRRNVDPRYGRPGDITSFTDGFPFLLVGEESLADLNSRLENEVPMNRFRPSIVIKGGKPYEEDEFGSFTINGMSFSGVKNCGRCVITTIDQQTAEKSREPLKTLASYRMQGSKINFGRYLIHAASGIIRLGDELKKADI